MSIDIDALTVARREAISKFLHDNDALFAAQDEEVDGGSDSGGPFMLGRWLLVLESRSLSDADDGLITVLRSPGTTFLDQAGLLNSALSY